MPSEKKEKDKVHKEKALKPSQALTNIQKTVRDSVICGSEWTITVDGVDVVVDGEKVKDE